MYGVLSKHIPYTLIRYSYSRIRIKTSKYGIFFAPQLLEDRLVDVVPSSLFSLSFYTGCNWNSHSYSSPRSRARFLGGEGTFSHTGAIKSTLSGLIRGPSDRPGDCQGNGQLRKTGVLLGHAFRFVSTQTQRLLQKTIMDTVLILSKKNAI